MRARCLEALLPQLERHEDRSFLDAAQEAMRAWRELLAERGDRQRPCR